MQAANNKINLVQAKGMPSLTKSSRGEGKVYTVFIIFFFICMSWPISELSLSEASWQVTLQFINHQ